MKNFPGIRDPYRIKKLIGSTITRHKLDLSGLTVLTEAATGNYVITPIVAAMAGAKKVYAVAGDSKYGTCEESGALTNKFADFCGIRGDKIEVVTKKDPDVIGNADIVTNLGFVRPINRAFIRALKKDAVIACMCESWEIREGDIDLVSCKNNKISVIAVNEEHPLLKIFDYCGSLCIKMLQELEIEIYNSRVVVISEDKFGRVISSWLTRLGASVEVFKGFDSGCKRFLRSSDALVIASYKNKNLFIGDKGRISAKELFRLSPGISVVQFCGAVETRGLKRLGIPHLPKEDIGHGRMAWTLAELGPKPVIELHSAGLKSAQIFLSGGSPLVGGVRFFRRVS